MAGTVLNFDILYWKTDALASGPDLRVRVLSSAPCLPSSLPRDSHISLCKKAQFSLHIWVQEQLKLKPDRGAAGEERCSLQGRVELLSREKHRYSAGAKEGLQDEELGRRGLKTGSMAAAEADHWW